MTDSNLQNTVPEGAFGIGSKKTDDFTENEKIRNFGIKDIPKALYEQLKKNSGAIVLPNQITEEVIQKAAKTQDEFLKPRSEEEATALRATAAGIADIPNEIKHIADWIQGNPYDPNELIDLKALGLEKEGDLDDAAYQVFKFGAGFLIPYAGFNKALKGIKGIKALQGIKNYDKIATGARWFTAGGAADFVGVDAYDENLFNFLGKIENPVLTNRFVKPIVEYLSAPERPEEGGESNFGEAKLKQFLTGTVFGETIGLTATAATKLPKLKNVLEPYAVRLIDDVTGGPNILNQKQMLDRTVQLFKDIKNDPTRLEFAKKQIKRLNKATLVGSEEFSDEFTKVLDDLPDINKSLTPEKNIFDIEIGIDDIDETQFFDKLNNRPPVKPFKTNLEAKRGLSRGADNLKKRLRLEVNTKGADPNEVEAIETFIDTIGERMFDKESLSITTKLAQGGEYNFANNLIRIRKQIVEGVEQGAGGGFEHVMIHELWHGLSRYLPEKDLARYTKEFKTAQAKYLKQFEKEKTAFIRNNTPESLSKLIGPSPISFKLPKITEANYLSKARKYFDSTKFKNENYRFTNIDEFFAENMADEFMDMYRGEGRIAGSPLDFAPQGTFKRIVQEVKLFIEDMFVSLQAKLGGSQTRKIFNDFVKRKNVKKYRNVPLDLENVEGVTGMAKKKKKDLGADLPLQKGKPNPNIWGDVESITEDVWETTGKALNRVVIPDDFSVEAASAMGYDELLPKVIQIAKKISPNDPEKHMRVLYLGAIKEQKRLAKNVTQYMNDIEQAFMLGEDISDDLLKNWSEDIVRMINLAGPTKKISNETAGTVRVNQLIDAEPKDVSRIPVDEQVAKGIGGGEKTADRVQREKFQTTTRDLVEKTKKQISEQKLVPTKEELYEGMQTYIKNNDIEGLLGITRKVLAMQGDSKRLSKLVKGIGFGEGATKVMRVSNEIFINSLLSAPETQIINIIGSLFNVALGPLDLAAGSPIMDMQMKKRAARELAAMFTTFKDSMTAAGKALWLDKNILDERRMFGQDAYERYAIRMAGDSMFAKSINLLGHGVRLPSRFMMAGDEVIKQTAFRSHLMGELAQQATEKGLTGKSFSIYVNSNFDEIINIVNTKSFTNNMDTAFPNFVPNENILDSYTRALDYAADRTFTTELGKGFGLTGAGSTQTKKLAEILKSTALKPIVPFVTTPVNIGKQVLRRTGVPDMQTLFKGMPPKYNATLGRILKEHNDNLLSEDLATAYRANGEATVGATIWAYFIALAAAKDNPEAELALVGGGHHNRWLREGEKRTDELPYSFRVIQKDKDGNIIRGDNGQPNYEYIDIFSRMEPIGSLLMIAGDMAYMRDFQSDEDYDNAAYALTALLSRNLNNKYMIQNIAQMIDLTSDVSALKRFYRIPVNYITNIINYPASLKRSITRARGEEWYDELTKKTFKGRFPKRKTKFRKGDLFPQEERTEDIGEYEGNDFGSLKESNNPFQTLDTIGLMIMRDLQDGTSGFSADIEPIRSITTGKIAEYPEGAFFGNYFNPFKYKKEKDNPIDEYLKRIQFKVVPPSDVIPFDNEGNGINLDTNAYNKLTGLIPNIPINFKGRNPVFDPKNGKRFGEMILELSRDKTNIKALKYLESDDSGAIDAQANLKNKDKVRKELQKQVRDIYKVYKKAAIEYYKEFILDPELKKQAENETRRANEDIMRIINPIVND